MDSHRNWFKLIFVVFCMLLLAGHASQVLAGDRDQSKILTFIPSLINGRNADSAHSRISAWRGTATCLTCHRSEAEEVFNSVHYQWLGKTPYMTGGPELQGKLDLGVNSYCINITGNWRGCSACHVGLGERPQQAVSYSQLENIDCLICHQQAYRRKMVDGKFVPDVDKMTISTLQAARTVHIPTRTTCLQCHAKGGGGDNFKRGDMALAHGNTRDRNFDVHMATSGADLNCQECHTTINHLMAGKGSDLRPTDLDESMSCTRCHEDKANMNGHGNSTIGRHVARVACQTCHIPTYARNAADTAADEKTEIHRDWLRPHTTASGAIHPTPTMAGDLIPSYRWWNGYSTNYLLFDKAVKDQGTGRYPTSRPQGGVGDNQARLFPFKYKTALQPLAVNANELIALDTAVYFSAGDPDAATRSGLNNMGYSAGSRYSWVETDTFQLLSHEVSSSSAALDCDDCHGNNRRMDLQGKLGYQLKGTEAAVCTQCHEREDEEEGGYRWIHEEHVMEKGFDCSWCHTFSRPERGLSRP